MFINEGAVKNSSKRKMKEVVAEPSGHAANATNNDNNNNNLLRFQPQLAPSPYNAQSSSQVQRILNATAPAIKPISFTSLLTAVDYEDEYERYDTHIRNPREQINRVISLHSESLKQSLAGVLESQQREADERARKKLKEQEDSRNAELEMLVEAYKREVESLKFKVTSMKRTMASLRTSLRASREGRADEGEEDEDSSSTAHQVDNEIKLACSTCDVGAATVMLWPCRHVCVCLRCDDHIVICPVCLTLKRTSYQVTLPSRVGV